MIRYAMVATASLIAALFVCAAARAAEATVVEQHTYLRSAPGLRAQLAEYVRRNWLAMDAIGLQRGLFTSYRLLERSGDEPAPWDFVVVVGYPTARAYDDPRTRQEFEAIRKAHIEIKIEGRSFADLGAVVSSETLVVRATEHGGPGSAD